MRKFTLMFVAGLIVSFGLARPAAAIPAFHKEFIKMYVSEDADQQSDLAKLVSDKKQKCLVCHQGKKKKNRNPYGDQLSEFLDKKEDKKDVEKIVASLQKVADMPSDPEDKDSPTFGELLAKGSLPGGSLEELTKEPAKEPADEEK